MMRRLSSEERQLWDILRRSVRPLRQAEEPAADALSSGNPAQLSAPVGGRGAAQRQAGRLSDRREPPLVALEERTRKRLARGLIEIGARIDLHGMRQDRAFPALIAFLRRAQAHGAQIVLVITGKGGSAESNRGVLRHNVPLWLARPEFRDLIVGFETADRKHGGSGALYVRLRKRALRAPPGRPGWSD